jgi:hypothetical protein
MLYLSWSIQSLQIYCEIMPRLFHCRFLPSPFQFAIYKSLVCSELHSITSGISNGLPTLKSIKESTGAAPVQSHSHMYIHLSVNYYFPICYFRFAVFAHDAVNPKSSMKLSCLRSLPISTSLFQEL